MKSVPPVLVTGIAGFIGFHVALRLLGEGRAVVGVDDLNPYYDVNLKAARLIELGLDAGAVAALIRGERDSIAQDRLKVFRFDLAERDPAERIFAEFRPAAVIHLAAQAGVRYSLENPRAYVRSNLDAFVNILEGARQHPPHHLIYASSSSVYGGNECVPFSEHQPVDHPVSLYAATKKANELMAHTYAHLFALPVTGLRFFTVYGPWGRPDMALFRFTRAILNGEPIQVYNHGQMSRDFTYIDDIVEGVTQLIPRPPRCDSGWDRQHPDPATSWAPYRVFNIGNHSPVDLLEFIALLEQKLRRKAVIERLPMQPGDVPATWADTAALNAATGFSPATPLAVGIGRFVDWSLDFYPAGSSGRGKT